ncbi:hypothetical protein [Vulgatibacter incomptus]|uniref:Uncharacterized protein n=1 Tax=Vulgatibacter incomptus TaxID=1391653 RepID=A0A0K1P7Y3_9BACT|nr:hypothetical protein [Vulgatibacter incomptus]AKU89622.1 hypothetical protein AKJ08_0009 [Vulgatibacter incomptus]AKU93326.1 hypothetical protein AKJ08_3713 [Vulgatibacter incomptus]
MHHRHPGGNVAIRPCEICGVLVLHEQTGLDEAELRASWRAFPHSAPGGPTCIGGGSRVRALRNAARAASGSGSFPPEPA